MTLTSEKLASYLGKDAAVLLRDTPFRDWPFRRSVDNDLADQCIDYVFSDQGVDVVCDADDRVSTIFIYFGDSRRYKPGLLDISHLWGRKEILDVFGLPSKSGERLSDPVLGNYGPWDRFDRTDYVIHFQYRFDADLIAQISLMRADVAP